MTHPAEVDQAAKRLVALYAVTERSLLVQIADTATSPRARVRLRALLAEDDGQLAGLRTGTAAWVRTELPVVYEVGARATAGTLGSRFQWAGIHETAVQALAETAWADVAGSLRDVNASTKRAIRDLLKESTRAQILEGLPGRQASDRYIRELQARTKAATVTYRNGARHQLGEWGDSAIRTVAANAHNVGTLNMAASENVRWVRCRDGPGCGLSSHDGGSAVNGVVFPIQTAFEHPLSHPRCSRSWEAEPLITSAKQAGDAAEFTDAQQIQAATEERERARTRLVDGRPVGTFAVGRTQRTARRTREQRTPRTARA